MLQLAQVGKLMLTELELVMLRQAQVDKQLVQE
jgi:hypothetical protein